MVRSAVRLHGCLRIPINQRIDHTKGHDTRFLAAHWPHPHQHGPAWLQGCQMPHWRAAGVEFFAMQQQSSQMMAEQQEPVWPIPSWAAAIAHAVVHNIPSHLPTWSEPRASRCQVHMLAAAGSRTHLCWWAVLRKRMPWTTLVKSGHVRSSWQLQLLQSRAHYTSSPQWWPVFIAAWLLPVFADSMLRWSTWPCFMGFVICHISGFPINQSLDSIHGQSRESIQPLDTSSIVPGSVTIIFHNTINMYICLNKYELIYYTYFFMFST